MGGTCDAVDDLTSVSADISALTLWYARRSWSLMVGGTAGTETWFACSDAGAIALRTGAVVAGDPR